MMILCIIFFVEDSLVDVEMVIDVLEEVCLVNFIVYVEDGVEVMDYLLCCGVFVNCEEGLLVVLLLDIKMLCMDGLEVLWQICEYEEFKCLLVVILLFLCEESDLVCSWDMGVNVYVVKLVDVDQFFGVVQILGKFWVLINQVLEFE